jgi:hypothetical protein
METGSELYQFYVKSSLTFEIEVDVHVLPESGRVVVPVGLGVAECLQDVVGLKQDVLHPLYLLLPHHVRHLRT